MNDQGELASTNENTNQQEEEVKSGENVTSSMEAQSKENQQEAIVSEPSSTQPQAGNASQRVIESDYKKIPLNSQHKLNSKWSFWYTSRKEKDFKTPYADRLKKIATFETLEEFFKYYMFLKPASEVEKNTDLALFKFGLKPLWESCPNGACWFLRFGKKEDLIDMDFKWEKLVFALIGEQYEEPNIIGAVLSKRGRETIMELWFNYRKDFTIKNAILSKMKDLMAIDKAMIVYFKENEKALQDKSTLRNAEHYNIGYGKRKNTYY